MLRLLSKWRSILISMKKILTVAAALAMLGAGCVPVQPTQLANSTTLPGQTIPTTTQSIPIITTPTPVTQPAIGGVGTVKLFMVALNDNGQSGKMIGCGDSIIPVTAPIPTTTAPLSAAFKALLAVQSKDYGQSGLYNPSYADANPNGSLQFVSASVVNGVAKIYLKGQISLPGVCEDPRLLSQFEEIAKQFSTVQKVEMYINGKMWSGSLKE